MSLTYLLYTRTNQDTSDQSRYLAMIDTHRGQVVMSQPQHGKLGSLTTPGYRGWALTYNETAIHSDELYMFFDFAGHRGVDLLAEFNQQPGHEKPYSADASFFVQQLTTHVEDHAMPLSRMAYSSDGEVLMIVFSTGAQEYRKSLAKLQRAEFKAIQGALSA